MKPKRSYSKSAGLALGLTSSREPRVSRTAPFTDALSFEDPPSRYPFVRVVAILAASSKMQEARSWHRQDKGSRAASLHMYRISLACQ